MTYSPRSTISGAIATISISCSACGTLVPQIGEAWEGRDIDNNIAYTIKRKIFCELATAIYNVNNNNKFILPGRKFIQPLPDSYGVQLQTTLTIEENTSLNPSVTLNRTLPGGFAAGIANIPQSYNIGFGGTASATATRTDTAYSYYLIKKIGHGQEEAYCNDSDPFENKNASSPLVRSSLGIEDFLESNVKPNAILRSSAPGESKSSKLDVFTYDIKFAVVTSGSVNPIWNLVPVSGGSGSPLLSSGRNRTHNLTLTFGPNAENGFEPSIVSLNQNLAANFKSATQQLRSIERFGQ